MLQELSSRPAQENPFVFRCRLCHLMEYEAADCILYYSGEDVRINEFLIEKQKENEELDYNERQIIRERYRDRLRKMTFYCFTNEIEQ